MSWHFWNRYWRRLVPFHTITCILGMPWSFWHKEQRAQDLILDSQFTSTPRYVILGNTVHFHSYYRNGRKYYGHPYSRTQNTHNNIVSMLLKCGSYTLKPKGVWNDHGWENILWVSRMQEIPFQAVCHGHPFNSRVRNVCILSIN